MTTDGRDALLRRNEDEYVLLRGVVDRLRGEGRIDDRFAGEGRDRSVRDVLAHLHAWHLLLGQWYADGMIGGSPAIPAEGYSWGELDDLNVALRDRWADADVEEVASLLEDSHARLQLLVAAHDDEELFNAEAYPWTRGSDLGEFCLECGGNHYAWARDAIDRGLRAETGREGPGA
ncbi:ClbS/DfsB family four-helix bundle protein [Micromonospora sp. DT81.3]|uniref:ClbS/DfsB family four-helix bundle protein n=1 Tax=Micromonospora sp. DT81.3 TaxID=3416523 RepID=UPI003CF9CE64